MNNSNFIRNEQIKKLKENEEYVEVYTLNEDGTRNNTGNLIKRGKPAGKGFYVIGVNNWIINSQGKVLVQKRSRYKKNNPSKWSSTNGLREPNEESINTIIRETKEELGIEIKPENISFVTSRVAGESLIVDIFVTKTDIDINEIKIQEEEVEEIKFVTLEELLKLDISTTCQYVKEIAELIFQKANELSIN